MSDKVEELPPNSVESEEALLGGILLDPDAVVRVISLVKPEDCYRKKNEWILEVAYDLHSNGVGIDFLTVCDELERRELLDEVGGPPFITDLINACPSSLHVEHYAHIIEKTGRQRRVMDAAAKVTEMANRGEEGFEDKSLTLIAKAGESRSSRRSSSLRDVESRSYDRMEAVARRGEEPLGVLTGFEDLDAIIGGFQPKCLYYLAGRPGQGKTALALDIARRAGKRGQHVALITLEMGEEQLSTRLESQESGIPFGDIWKAKVGPRWDMYARAVSTLSDLPIWINEAVGVTPSWLRAELMRLDAEFGIDLAIVDYLQLMNPDERQPNLYHAASANSRALKLIAMGLNMPILALSQLSRKCEERQDKRPMLSDLADSGKLEADADAVLFMYRDDYYNENSERANIADVIVAKQRNGPTDTISLYYQKDFMRFMDAMARRVTVEML